jgi:hypothetical protein
MLLATRTANKGTHIYNVPHFAPPHPEYMHTQKKLECRGCEEECCISFIFTDGP